MKVLQGALSGFAATLPMSVFMELSYKTLPKREKYPLPPRLITDEVLKKAGPVRKEAVASRFTLLSHFAYGAVAAVPYTVLPQDRRVPGWMRGALYGLALWGGSYLGWLPAAGILSPATRHPRARNLLMISAHLVYGACLGSFYDQAREASSDRKLPSVQ